MRNMIFGVVMLLCISCKTSDYKIEGTFDDVKEGLVYIKMLANNEWVFIDSTEIQNGKFEFKGGPVEEVSNCYLEIKGNQDSRQVLFIEAGTITVSGNVAEKNVRIVGTVNNDAFYDYLTSLRPLQEKIMKVLKDAETTWLGGDTTQVEHYTKLFMDVRAQFPVLRSSFFEKYKETDFGVYLLTEMASGSSITASQVDSLILLVPAQAKNSPYFAKLKKRSEILKVSDPGTLAPDIALSTPQGDIVALSSLRGKYVLLDFWASWCGPCRAEIPHLMKIYEKYRADGFDVYSVSLDDKMDAWTKAISETGMTWTQVSDLKGMKSPVAKQYAVSGIPAIWLLDKEGKIVDKNLRGDALDAKLKEIFGH